MKEGHAAGWRHTALAIFTLAVLTRIVAATALAVVPRDAIAYLDCARAVAGGAPADAFRGGLHPLLPLLIGALGGSLAAGVVLVSLAGGLGAVAALSLGTRLHSRAAGVFAGLFFAVAPGLVRYGSAPLGEGLSVPLSLLAVERAVAALGRRRAGLPAGLAAGLAYLARPEALLLPVVLVPALLCGRRGVAALLLLTGFLLPAAPYAAHLTAEAGALTVTRKKPALRFLHAEEGFDAHMAEKAKRTGLPRPGVAAAAGETLRTFGEATSWALLPLAAAGAWLLLRRSPRAAPLLLLALLAADLAVRYRLLHLHGYLGRRHLALATALVVPLAAAGVLAFRRWGPVLAALLAVAGLTASVKPRDREKAPLREAGRHILEAAGGEVTVATFLTPRVPFYAGGRDLPLHRVQPSLRADEGDPALLRERIEEGAAWLALVPGRLTDRQREVLLEAAPGSPSVKVGEGEWQVWLWRLR